MSQKSIGDEEEEQQQVPSEEEKGEAESGKRITTRAQIVVYI